MLRPGRGATFRLAVLLVLLVCGPLSSVHAQDRPYSEDEVKAAFLYHFGTYVEWPPRARGEQAITIAVLGAPSVVAELTMFLPGRTIQGRPVKVRAIGAIRDLGDDEILFIGREFNARLRDLIGGLRDKPVLVVTDAPDGLDRGAMVNFQLVNERVRFEISLPHAQDAGLMLSSRLLAAALRVETSSSWNERLQPLFGALLPGF